MAAMVRGLIMVGGNDFCVCGEKIKNEIYFQNVFLKVTCFLKKHIFIIFFFKKKHIFHPLCTYHKMKRAALDSTTTHRESPVLQCIVVDKDYSHLQCFRIPVDVIGEDLADIERLLADPKQHQRPEVSWTDEEIPFMYRLYDRMTGDGEKGKADLKQYLCGSQFQSGPSIGIIWGWISLEN